MPVVDNEEKIEKEIYAGMNIDTDRTNAVNNGKNNKARMSTTFSKGTQRKRCN